MRNTATITAPTLTAEARPAFRDGLVVPLLGLTVIIVIMNTMMFNLALPQVTAEFMLSSSAASWIITGYSIVFAISSITYSRLSDFVPIRRLLMIGLIAMGGASVLGFFSHHYILLLVARLIQASGAGSVLSLTIVLITRFIPLDRRGKSMALITSAASLGLGLGPVIGGAITQYLGWNDLFIVTGISLLFIPVFYKLLPDEAVSKGTFDILGALLVGIGSTGVLLYITNHFWIALIVGITALVLFWLRINRAVNPFVQPTLFRNKRYIRLITLGIVSYINNFATLFLLPQVLIHLFKLTPGQAGLIIFPGALVAMLSSNRIGKIIDRHGNSMLLRLAPLPLLLAAISFALFADRSIYVIMVIYILMSVGFSALNSSVSNELSRILPSEHVGAGMGLFQLSQFISGAFSVAISGIVLASQSKLPLSSAFSNIFWGMAVIAVIAIAATWLYYSSSRQQLGVKKPL
ncbi:MULTISPECIES: MFS transporter [Bacillales]|uniref:MFS transporter n=1 Tax=Bacillales TaxID=1385 RepID=UPI0006A7AE03|nr:MULTISPECIES: MFS transporter [Bacillales]OBZ13007.1 tetracycline resistance protein TetA [Bacillus sp. FJAT-26390]